jgi:hypothetical protein
MVLVDPDLDKPRPNLVSLLKDWNLEAGPGVVVDIWGRRFMGSPLDALGRFLDHEITRDFDRRVAALFPEARSLQPGTTGVDRVTVQPLVSTMVEAEDRDHNVLTWSETDLAPNRPVRYDDGKDKKGPLTLAALVTVRVPERPTPAPTSGSSPGATASPSPVVAPTPTPAPSPSPSSVTAAVPGAPSPAPTVLDVSPSPPAGTSPLAGPSASPQPTPTPGGPEERPEGRVVAVGDADFASNGFVRLPLGNADFFLNSLTWLMQDSELMAIRPKDPEDQRIFVEEGQRRFVGLVALAFLPAAFIVLGVRKWWRRR